MKRLSLFILTLIVFAGAAFAHNGMEHVMGTVTALTDTTVSVQAMNGTIQTISVSADTKYLKGDTSLTLKDIKVGDNIVIHAAMKDGKLTAVEVKVSAMKGMHGDMGGMDMGGTKAKPQ